MNMQDLLGSGLFISTKREFFKMLKDDAFFPFWYLLSLSINKQESILYSYVSLISYDVPGTVRDFL